MKYERNKVFITFFDRFMHNKNLSFVNVFDTESLCAFAKPSEATLKWAKAYTVNEPGMQKVRENWSQKVKIK